ncbi:MAG TPA: response regulator [Caulobacteraceae bacterium]|jgi:CheY-like chemotaxis protein
MTSRSDTDDGSTGGDLFQLVCGEARTPLEGIVAVADRLARQPMSADGQACVKTIRETAQALLRRFDQAAELASGRAGRRELAAEPVQLRALMDEVQAGWQGRAGEGVTLLVSYDGDPDLACLGDAGRLRQLFDCLVGSALRVTPRGAVEASLRARAEVGVVRLEGRVRDGGSALARQGLSNLFEPAAAGAETELSLSLSRELAEAMGGSIRGEANAGAGGSILFQLDLPPIQKAEEAEPAGGTLAHVLVVDDNATNRMVAQSLCEMFDCTSEAVEDGVEAVEAVRTGRFDLILMDIKMPRMDGVEATRAIRQLPGAPARIPIIALTANADPDDARAYIACGMCSVVEKPINPERLLQAMNAAFAEQPATDAKSRAA